MNYIKTIYA